MRTVLNFEVAQLMKDPHFMAGVEAAQACYALGKMLEQGGASPGAIKAAVEAVQFGVEEVELTRP